MSVYRSGLRFSPPLALGGHAFNMALPPHVSSHDLFDHESDAPAIWRCGKCYVLAPSWGITEGFYPRPCLGGVAALEEAP